jgi:hypothetical protein
MTAEQEALLASLRQLYLKAEDTLGTLIASRAVPVPLVRDGDSYVESEDNEWNAEWKKVIERRCDVWRVT